MIRNFINITGIAHEDELPIKINSQMIQYSDIETLFIPEDSPEIKSIYEIMVEVEIKSNRMIHSPLGNIIVIDGIKKYKIIYTENENNGKTNMQYLNVPYNTFIEFPNKQTSIPKIKVYILDAYFDLLAPRKIYSHTLYLVDVDSTSENNDLEIEDNAYSLDLKNNLETKENHKKALNEMVISKEMLKENRPIDHNNLVDIDAEYL
ncbi:hypothetical protein IZY60_13535 [Lutibacter sp. B2]|nr:hypothetical protein [Lutibacter sp. B2]